jgi:hypothetical protein
MLSSSIIESDVTPPPSPPQIQLQIVDRGDTGALCESFSDSADVDGIKVEANVDEEEEEEEEVEVVEEGVEEVSVSSNEQADGISSEEEGSGDK